MQFDVLPAPFGALTAVFDGEGKLCELWTKDASAQVSQRSRRDEGVSSLAREEFDRYFAGELTEFSIPLGIRGSGFQRQVWDLLMQIPYGQTRTYGDLARKLGEPNAARAVGRANATNPIAIIVPCHRVIGASGALTGYAGGLDIKRTLLELEASRLGNLFS